jgi:hypothetical protein
MELSRNRPGSGSGANATDVEAAVIGAGPHGLAATIMLRRAGVNTSVFGEPMGFWKTMPEGMMLRSNLSASNMIEPAGPYSLSSFGEATGVYVDHPVALSDFVSYGLWVTREAVPDVDRRFVSQLTAAPGGFRLTLADGECVSATSVVVAGGISPFAHTPPGFEHLSPERFSHSAGHSDLSVFAGRRVAVVGGGQSAFECAALMVERGAADVEVIVRDERIVFLRGRAVKRVLGRLGPVVYAPTDVGPLWYSRLVSKPDICFRRLPRLTQDRIALRCIRPACSHFVRVRLGGVRTTTGVELLRAGERDGSLRLALSDGSVREVDHLMFATGYRVDVARYPFIAPELASAIRRHNGYPVLGRGLESSIAGLHFSGAPAAWSYGPIMRFVSGSWYAAAALSRAIARGPARARPLMAARA